ncbi:MAG: YdcF family protein [Gammaproteobacteria bacterium]|nr:YdcF family protein [Gammaproteobacteria bacterium]
MYVYLSKILPVFVMPLGVVSVLLLLALFFIRRDKRRTAAGLLGLGLAVLWLASTPFVAAQLYRQLESRYPPVPLEDVPIRGCMVVLGGVLGGVLPPRVEVDMNDSIDRIYKAAALYRAGKAPSVIVTGGNQPWSKIYTAEADLIRDLLIEWGVPKDVIFLEGSSRNTRENALYSKNIIDAMSCTDALLVTSAAHMPRAVAAFNSVGVAVTPVSTDVRAVGQALPGIMDFVPSAGALATTSDAIREWIGQKVYSWQGWN